MLVCSAGARHVGPRADSPSFRNVPYVALLRMALTVVQKILEKYPLEICCCCRCHEFNCGSGNEFLGEFR